MIINKSLIRGYFSLLVTPPLSNNLNFLSLPIPFSLSSSPPPLSHGRYFSLYSPPELSFPYTCSSSKPSLEYLSHQTSSSACGHKSRYNAFNVVVATFLQIFWSLPSSLYVHEASLRGGNFVENYYSGSNKQLNRVQQIRGGISPRKVSRLFPTPKILVVFNFSFIPPRTFRFSDKTQDPILINLDSRKPKAQYT